MICERWKMRKAVMCRYCGQWISAKTVCARVTDGDVTVIVHDECSKNVEYSVTPLAALLEEREARRAERARLREQKRIADHQSAGARVSMLTALIQGLGGLR